MRLNNVFTVQEEHANIITKTTRNVRNITVQKKNNYNEIQIITIVRRKEMFYFPPLPPNNLRSFIFVILDERNRFPLCAEC